MNESHKYKIYRNLCRNNLLNLEYLAKQLNDGYRQNHVNSIRNVSLIKASQPHQGFLTLIIVWQSNIDSNRSSRCTSGCVIPQYNSFSNNELPAFSFSSLMCLYAKLSVISANWYYANWIGFQYNKYSQGDSSKNNQGNVVHYLYYGLRTAKHSWKYDSQKSQI